MNRKISIGMAVTIVILAMTVTFSITMLVAMRLFEEGVYVNPVLPPAAPADGCLLRTSYMATLTEPLIDEAVEIIGGVLGEKV